MNMLENIILNIRELQQACETITKYFQASFHALTNKIISEGRQRRLK